MTNYSVREHPIIHHFIFIDQLYATCWYRILSTLNVRAGPWKNQKYHFLSMGPWEHLEWCGATRSDTRAPKVPFPTKMTKILLINLGLTEVKQGQNPYKITPFIVFHQTRASRTFLATLTKFDLKLTISGPKNLILIRPSERVETNVIAKIFKFSFQRLFMGWNRS